MTKVLRYTVRNTGTGDSGPLMLRITGAAEYSILATTCKDVALAPAASCTVDVQLTPMMGMAGLGLEGGDARAHGRAGRHCLGGGAGNPVRLL